MFEADPQGYEEGPCHEAGDDEVGSVTLKLITPDQALVEWLATHGFSRLIGRLPPPGFSRSSPCDAGIRVSWSSAGSGVVDERTYDLIVIGAPAAGHAVGLRGPWRARRRPHRGSTGKRARSSTSSAIPTDAKSCWSPSRRNPRQRTGRDQLRRRGRAGVRLGPVIVNAVLPEVAGLDIDLDDLTAAELALNDDERRRLRSHQHSEPGAPNCRPTSSNGLLISSLSPRSDSLNCSAPRSGRTRSPNWPTS